MKNMRLERRAAAVLIASVVAVGGSASAKGDLVAIGISGGDLAHEVRIAASNEEMKFSYAERPSGRGPGYQAIFYMRIPGGSRVFPSSPYTYHPMSSRGPAVFDSGREADFLMVIPVSLAGRLDRAIETARTVRSPRKADAQPATAPPNWPAWALIVPLSVAGAALLARRG